MHCVRLDVLSWFLRPPIGLPPGVREEGGGRMV